MIEHDDNLADALALVEAAGWRDDPEAFGCVVRHCDQGKTTVILAKLLAELLADNNAGIGACPYRVLAGLGSRGDYASMTEIEQLAFRNELLERRIDALRALVAEMERERAGLLATIARLREKAFRLAAQVGTTP